MFNSEQIPVQTVVSALMYRLSAILQTYLCHMKTRQYGNSKRHEIFHGSLRLLHPKQRMDLCFDINECNKKPMSAMTHFDRVSG